MTDGQEPSLRPQIRPATAPPSVPQRGAPVPKPSVPLAILGAATLTVSVAFAIGATIDQARSSRRVEALEAENTLLQEKLAIATAYGDGHQAVPSTASPIEAAEIHPAQTVPIAVQTGATWTTTATTSGSSVSFAPGISISGSSSSGATFSGMIVAGSSGCAIMPTIMPTAAYVITASPPR